MRNLIIAAMLTGCASLPASGDPAGHLGGEPLVDCVRWIEVGPAPIDDITHLELETASTLLEVSWRGEVDRWYPVTVTGTVTREASQSCRVTVDDGPGVWTIDARCGHEVISGTVTACRYE